MPTYDFICEVCGMPGRRYSKDQPPKFCSRKCMGEGKTGGKKTMYVITPEMHERIKAVYQTRTETGEVKALAESLGLPRWKISRHAIAQGWVPVRHKEPDWSGKELRILESSAHLHPERIQKNLKRVGFRRTVTAIVLKRKRMRYLANKNGHSAHSVAQCFGVDGHAVVRWIRLGYLKAMMRGTRRTPQQGGDQYYIKESWIRNFVINCIDEIDIRKVDKYWFVDLLAGGRYGLEACRIERAPDVTVDADEDMEDTDDPTRAEVLDLFAEAAVL